MKSYLSATACIFALAISGTASAQTEPNAASSGADSASTGDANRGVGLEEIIVTARKREENLQKAPATILAISGDALQSRGITGPLELTKVLPNASLKEQGAVSQLFIRGVGSRVDFPSVSPAAAFTYNGIIIPRYGTSGVLFDLSSVQSIAGPQGTLYGGSAAGGAVNVLTAKPSDDNSGKALVGFGDYSTIQFNADQNFKASDKIALRLAGSYNEHGAYQDRGLDDLKRIQGRVSLLARPTEDLTALFFASGSRTTGDPGSVATVYLRPIQSDPWAVPAVGPTGLTITDRDTYQDYRTYVVGANIDLRVGDGTITYIPGYVRVNSKYNFYIAGYNLLLVHDREKQLSQELRYNQDIGNLKLSAGLFWLRNKTNYLVDFEAATPGGYLTFPANRTSQVNVSYSAFAQGIYSLTDQLRFTAGGRISVDKISATGLGGKGAFAFHEKQTRPDWKVGLDYDLTSRIMLYAAVQTGYIPFGYDSNSGTPTVKIRQSKLMSYTGGFKSRLFDNRLEINNEFFYYDYTAFQAFSFNSSTGTSTVFNARKSRIYGTDLTVRLHLNEHTSINAGVVAESAIHKEFRGPGYNYSGNRMANAPKINIQGGIQQGFDIGDSGVLLAEVSGNYNSGYWGDYTNTFGTFQRPFFKGDASLTYTPASKAWSIQAYVNNVANTGVFGTLTPNPNPALRGTGKSELPRTFGVRFTASWGE
ncbi:TonB-dependent receptor [Sphingobium subterraneum]|uniref:Iron complex outermembrane receptor protein n=1 Tax=Sphingobium subterraneum TaxID=627688 RepID=A0A841J475_9SPHN|nr:TonB-dependent receptor [Sphingobium subterraneum]MBB6123051.1 iron complex outermembrane receptor protein [Sphingobium subterraneum]